MLDVVLTIPFWLELSATLTGGLSGAMSAVRARYDLFGVACIAIVTGLAGGIIRDILLQSYGIYAFQKPSLIVTCVVAGLIVFYFGKLTTYLDPIVDLLDNLSVALWAIIAVGKALSAGLDIIPAAILGTITAVGGGICRDICMNKEPVSFQAGALYGSAAFIGAFVYALMYQNHILANYAAMTCAILVLGIRYASRLFDWHTKAPRDYSYLVTKPVQSVVNKVRPPKGKVRRERDRRKYEKVVRVLKKLSGMPLEEPSTANTSVAEETLPYESRAEVMAQLAAQQAAEKAASAASAAEKAAAAAEAVTAAVDAARASGSGAREAQVSRAMESAEVFRQAIAEQAARAREAAAEARDAGEARGARGARGTNASDTGGTEKEPGQSQGSDRIVVPAGELRKLLGHEEPGHTGVITPLPEDPSAIKPDDRIVIPADALLQLAAKPEAAPADATDDTAADYRADNPKYHTH